MDKVQKFDVSLTVRMLRNVGLEVEAESPMDAMKKVDEVIRRGQIDFILDEKAYKASWNNIRRSSGVSEGVNAYEMGVREDYVQKKQTEAHWTASDEPKENALSFDKVKLSPMANYGFKRKADPKDFELKDGKWVQLKDSHEQFTYLEAKKNEKKTGEHWTKFTNCPEIYSQGIKENTVDTKRKSLTDKESGELQADAAGIKEGIEVTKNAQ